MPIVVQPPPPPEPLSEAVSTSLTASDYARMLAKIEAQGLTRAAYLRALVVADLGK